MARHTIPRTGDVVVAAAGPVGILEGYWFWELGIFHLDLLENKRLFTLKNVPSVKYLG